MTYAALAGLGPYNPFTDGKARDQFVRDRTFDVLHTRLDLSFDLDARAVAGAATHTVRPIHEVRGLELDAVDLECRAVTLHDGQSLPFRHAAGKLSIELDRAYRADEELTVRIDYRARPRKGLYFVRPDKGYPKKPVQVWSQGESEDNRYWYPCYDSPNDKATTEAVLTVPAAMTALSNGRLERVSEDRGRGTRTFHWRQEVPHVNYLVAVVIGEFDEVADDCDGLPVLYYVGKGDAARARATFGKTPDMIRFFADRIGCPYPYAKYAQVAIADFMWGGMENTTLTTINERSLIDERVRPDVDSDGLVAHELAHQWWGDLITTKSWSHLWLNEGFATYFDVLFCEHDRGVEEFQQRILDNMAAYFSEDGEKYRRPIVTHSFGEPEDVFDRHSYQKASLVLHMLRGVLGDDLWWKAVRHYAERHATRSVETADLKVAIEEATGRSVEGFFQQWLWRSGYPEYEVKWEWEERARLVRLSVSQKQAVTAETPLFRMPVDVLVLAGGRVARHRLDVERAEHTFYLAAETRPDAVQFDPDAWLLAKLAFEKPKAELLCELRVSPGVVGRIRACEGLGKLAGDDAVVEGLGKALGSDAFFGVRRAAARALGRIGTAEAREALTAGFGDANPKVRRAVAEALGAFRRDDGAARILAARVRRERSDYVTAEGLKSLGKTRTAKAFTAICAGLARDSHNEVVRAHVFHGLAELGDARAVPLAREGSAYGKPPTVRAAAALCLGKLWEQAREQREEIRDHLLFLLKDADHFMRRNVMDALGGVTDDRAVAALQDAAAAETIGMIRHVARESAQRIRDRQGRESSLADLKRSLEEVRDENQALKAKLEDLRLKVASLAEHGGAKRRTSGGGAAKGVRAARGARSADAADGRRKRRS
ncbi:MAG: HEAT repeat domain-containing protein [Planctomycetes bacterium]|nr:HEAT repeat domain-containing protein [Planctomycetota bacterium]